MHSIKKLRASQIHLLRYIEAQQAYELRVVWQSQIPIPPTVRYIKDIFLAPYASITTDYLHDNQKSFRDELNSQQISQHSTQIAQQKAQKKLKQDEYLWQSRQSKKTNIICSQKLDYDLLMTRNYLIATVIERNKSIIKQSTPKDILRKKKKIM